MDRLGANGGMIGILILGFEMSYGGEPSAVFHRDIER